jgi:hypothetical protein
MNSTDTYFTSLKRTQINWIKMKKKKFLDQAKEAEWHTDMAVANIDIFSMTYEESVTYFKQLENSKKSR